MKFLMTFARFAADPRSVFDVWDEYEIDPCQLREWQNNRRGCVADRRTAEHRHQPFCETSVPSLQRPLAFTTDAAFGRAHGRRVQATQRRSCTGKHPIIRGS